jgi:alcohol dehydrogenase (cytochrome c)
MPGVISWRACRWTGALAAAAAGLALSAAARAAEPGPAASGPAEPAAYRANCAACHGDDLGGRFGPALSGSAFLGRWRTRSADALRDYVRLRMPPAKPGGLGEADYAAATAYVEQASGLEQARRQRANGDVMNDKGEAIPSSWGRPNYDATYRAARARLEGLAGRLSPVAPDGGRTAKPADWTRWRGDAATSGFSRLTQINTGNVAGLKLAWSLALGSGTNAVAPLVRDGVMFLNASGTVEALDAASGAVIWSYARPAASTRQPISQPRGIALSASTVIVPTLDNHLLALDARTGKLVWDTVLAPADSGFQLTSAPLVVRDKIVQGVAGCFGVEVPGGCYIVGLDAASGRVLWRFDTIAKSGRPGGDSWRGLPDDQRFGASVWTAGSYDPELNLVYFGTAQTYRVSTLLKAGPQPDSSSAALFTDSTLALDPDTGALAWHYQHQARDVWDLDWAFEQTIAETSVAGHRRKVILTVGKMGIVEALDARTGAYLWSYDLGLQNVVAKIDPRTGAKTVSPAAVLEPRKPKLVCPSLFGARSWPTTAYDPVSETLYVPLSEACMMLTYDPAAPGSDMRVGDVTPRPGADGRFGQIAAVDVRHATLRWRERRRAPSASALLATAGGLLFEGSLDGWFFARDSRSGKVLWKAKLADTPNSFPITFMAGGRQFVAVATGGGSVFDLAFRHLTPEIPKSQAAMTLWVFSVK